MSYEEFLEQIKRQIQERMGDGAAISVFQVRKNNGVLLDGLSILGQGDNLSPAIYLNGYYREYLKGISLEEIGNRILDCYRREKKTGHFDMDILKNGNRVKTRIICRLINYEKNRILLRDVPYRRFLNLAIVYYYLMEDWGMGEASILVRKKFLPLWGMDTETLHHTALANTARLLPWDFLSLSEMFQETACMEFREEEPKVPLYILTSQAKHYGAVWITDPHVRRLIGEKLGDDYYVLPSSIHECMILPAGLRPDPKELQDMVREINLTQVEPEEILADSVYRYERHTERLETAAE